MDLAVGVGPAGQGQPARPASAVGAGRRRCGPRRATTSPRACWRSRTAPPRSPRTAPRPRGTPRRPTRRSSSAAAGTGVGVRVGQGPGRDAQVQLTVLEHGAPVAALGQAGAPPRGERDVPGRGRGQGHQLALEPRGGQRVRAVADHVGQAARAAQAAARRVALEPDVLELATVVGTTDAGAGPRRRVVDHHVAGGGEPDDHHEVPVARADRSAGQLAARERDRRDDGDARADERLEVAQGREPGHERVPRVARGVGGVEGPVARAVVPVVEGHPRGVVDGAVDVRLPHPGVLRAAAAASCSSRAPSRSRSASTRPRRRRRTAGTRRRAPSASSAARRARRREPHRVARW